MSTVTEPLLFIQPKLGKKTTVYRELRKRCLHLIEHYHNDLLVHDRRILRHNPGVPFLHWTRATGTCIELLFPHNDERWPKRGEEVKYLFGFADREHILKQVVGTSEYRANKMNTETRLVLYHDGKDASLKEISLDRAVEIAKDHQRRVLRMWNA